MFSCSARFISLHDFNFVFHPFETHTESKSQYIITKLLGIKHLYLNVSWEILHHQISFSQDSRLLCLCLGFCLIVIPQCLSCPALYIWLIFVLPGPLHILLHLFISLECESPKGDQVLFISVFPKHLISTELACIHEHMPFLFNYIESKSHKFFVNFDNWKSNPTSLFAFI